MFIDYLVVTGIDLIALEGKVLWRLSLAFYWLGYLSGGDVHLKYFDQGIEFGKRAVEGNLMQQLLID
jgi:hypothetical protein